MTEFVIRLGEDYYCGGPTLTTLTFQKGYKRGARTAFRTREDALAAMPDGLRERVVIEEVE